MSKEKLNININLGLLTWLTIGILVAILLFNIITPKEEVEVIREESSAGIMLEEIRKLESKNRNLVTKVWKLECIIDGIDLDDCFTY